MESRHVPEEIVADILVKLPVKSIIRFESVSKSWCVLIKSSCFVRKHQIESDESFLAMCLVAPRIRQCDYLFLGGQQTNYICYYEAYAAFYKLSGHNFELSYSSSDNCFQHLEGNLTWHVAGDFNGIICFTNYHKIMLVNPSLKEVKTLPINHDYHLPVVGNPPGFWICNLVGFGFDNTSNDFKVVTVLSCRNWYGIIVQQRVEVYNLKSNVWRELNDIQLPAVVVNYSFNDSTFFKGCVHWYSSWGIILTFDMADNLFNRLECPRDWYETRENMPYFRLFVLNNESLAFLSYPRPCTKTDFVNVWITNKHGVEASWTKVYTIRPLTQFHKPLSFWNKDKFIYKATNGNLILFDLLNHTSSIVCDVSRISVTDPCLMVCSEFGIYKPSLVSINI